MSLQITVVVVPPPLGFGLGLGEGGFDLGGLSPYESGEDELDSVEMVSRSQIGQRDGPGGVPVQE